MRSLPFLLIAGFALLLMTGEANADNDSETDSSFLPLQIVVAVILASLYHVRRGTGYDNSFNKVLKIILYGIAIISLVISILFWVLNGFLVGPPESVRKIWLWWMAYAMLFALTGSFLGHESSDYSYTPQSQKLGQTSTSSKPIFANRRRTPMFTPEKKLANIECPGCNAQMKVPKLGKMQNVTCKKCGLSGEIEI